MKSHPVKAWVAAGLILLSLVVFLPALDCDFIALDDDAYVTQNAQVTAGLTPGGLVWAFTSFGYQSNWHPLTWISHMLDVQLFGLDPRGHHATNLVLHTANTALLFLVLERASGALWPSALVAALFCVHPAHVETVAWVSDRKGALSTLFWMLALGAWLRHLRAPRPGRFLAALALFAAGLLAKPMVVTLPLVLLLLDWWPLGRARPANSFAPSSAAAARRGWVGLVGEKAPFLALSLAGSVATYLAQHRGGAMVFTGLQHGWVRLSDAVVSSTGYLGKLVLPRNLSLFYPLPQTFHSTGKIAASALLLLGFFAAAALLRRRAPALATGWGWFCVALLPVSGLVQVGNQSMADRYTYLPFVGLFVALAWGIPALLPRTPRRAWTLAAACGVALALLVGRTRSQLSFWRDSETLLGHSLEIAPGSWMLHVNLGTWLLERGRAAEAVGHFVTVLRDDPSNVQAAYNLGIALNKQGRLEEAAEAFHRALRIDPTSSEAHNNLGAVLFAQGKVREAFASFSEAVRLGPGNQQARANLAITGARLREDEQREAR